MPVYEVTVERARKWTFKVRANDKESAKSTADELAVEQEAFPHEDYLVSTTIGKKLPDDAEAENDWEERVPRKSEW